MEQLKAFLHDKDEIVRRQAVLALRNLGSQAAIGILLASLYDEDRMVRESTVRALGNLGQDLPVEPLLAMLGDSDHSVREATIRTCEWVYPEAFSIVEAEATAILLDQGSGALLGSLTQNFIAETIGDMEIISPSLLNMLIKLLDWPHWETRMKAAKALGKHRRNIPDATIRRLLDLRYDSQSQAVCAAADEALAEILSLERGIEDD